jgi:putative oxidoreductase
MLPSVQRLFTIFPNSLPGLGLLLLRVTTLAAVMADGPLPSPLVFVQALCGGLLLIGLWTPVAATACCLIEAWLAILAGPGAGTHAAFAGISLSLALLGPGAWSLDCRLYGRRRVTLEAHRE